MWRVLFSKITVLEFISATQRFFHMSFERKLFYKIAKSSARYFCKYFLTKLLDASLYVATKGY